MIEGTNHLVTVSAEHAGFSDDGSLVDTFRETKNLLLYTGLRRTVVVKTHVKCTVHTHTCDGARIPDLLPVHFHVLILIEADGAGSGVNAHKSDPLSRDGGLEAISFFHLLSIVVDHGVGAVGGNLAEFGWIPESLFLVVGQYRYTLLERSSHGKWTAVKADVHLAL